MVGGPVQDPQPRIRRKRKRVQAPAWRQTPFVPFAFYRSGRYIFSDVAEITENGFISRFFLIPLFKHLHALLAIVAVTVIEVVAILAHI